MSEGAATIGLKKSRIQTAVEVRLRSARLYSDSKFGSFVRVSVHVVGSAFTIDLEHVKQTIDPITEVPFLSATWKEKITGTHSRDPEYIVQNLSKLVDQFLLDFLRVNEEECRQKD